MKSYILKYLKVHHNPLSVDEVGKCLCDLLRKIHDALEEFHWTFFSHNDICLENICFDTSFNAFLIDVDRCTYIDCAFDGSAPSCMHPRNLPPSCTDYVQLGWLAAWVLNPTGQYHERKWDDLPPFIKTDTFISSLIQKGLYLQEQLNSSTVIHGGQLVESVISSRNVSVWGFTKLILTYSLFTVAFINYWIMYLLFLCYKISNYLWNTRGNKDHRIISHVFGVLQRYWISLNHWGPEETTITG